MAARFERDDGLPPYDAAMMTQSLPFAAFYEAARDAGAQPKAVAPPGSAPPQTPIILSPQTQLRDRGKAKVKAKAVPPGVIQEDNWIHVDTSRN